MLEFCTCDCCQTDVFLLQLAVTISPASVCMSGYTCWEGKSLSSHNPMYSYILQKTEHVITCYPTDSLGKVIEKIVKAGVCSVTFY